MHFVTGGAYNGKSKWVKEYYQRKGKVLNAYNGDILPVDLTVLDSNILVIEGIEQFLKEDCKVLDAHTCREIWRKRLKEWKIWEASGRKRLVVIIGADITKGIVPLAQADRKWRDMTGWVYQDISSNADRVDVIWYGLNRQIK
ncbi:bifunctional adenosylcobinamide kinase/adenosylcobinamide-phosphate guanylyltransferase [Bacillus sp. CECT 9360]|uniref:bifunctional adenosylcobinamide kinase/adenosylcobinamide-phosphate guanylyltransferase n=1 Tax=Bacillus sp. CECT 9360 TaxID=2845821 RepID=UPI001E5D6579|nr:bifunctional adenosylcobinamide kinase/adenosylcobinamide-phosphate guanylyltransferase [Bacillus sp. CECT 9360]CAH0344998.1 hypothetical protein BCI9360_01274 [Bacillus sp. CECT 9360]